MYVAMRVGPRHGWVHPGGQGPLQERREAVLGRAGTQLSSKRGGSAMQEEYHKI